MATGLKVTAGISHQTHLPPMSCGSYHPHRLLRASTIMRPRPLTASSPTSLRIGGCGLASHTMTARLSGCARSHRWMGEGSGCLSACDSRSALVAISETTSSAVSVSSANPHSASTARVCARAFDAALKRGPSSRWLVNRRQTVDDRPPLPPGSPAGCEPYGVNAATAGKAVRLRPAGCRPGGACWSPLKRSVLETALW